MGMQQPVVKDDSPETLANSNIQRSTGTSSSRFPPHSQQSGRELCLRNNTDDNEAATDAVNALLPIPPLRSSQSGDHHDNVAAGLLARLEHPPTFMAVPTRNESRARSLSLYVQQDMLGRRRFSSFARTTSMQSSNGGSTEPVQCLQSYNSTSSVDAFAIPDVQTAEDGFENEIVLDFEVLAIQTPGSPNVAVVLDTPFQQDDQARPTQDAASRALEPLEELELELEETEANLVFFDAAGDHGVRRETMLDVPRARAAFSEDETPFSAPRAFPSPKFESRSELFLSSPAQSWVFSHESLRRYLQSMETPHVTLQ